MGSREQVSRFIRSSFRSVWSLEVLLLLKRDQRSWAHGEIVAALRASELKCDIIFKATKVDGIYTADPEKDPTAERLPHVTYQRVLAERLQVMDAAAIDLARNSSIPIYIFSLRERGNIRRALLGEDVGSIVSDDVPATSGA